MITHANIFFSSSFYLFWTDTRKDAPAPNLITTLTQQRQTNQPPLVLILRGAAADHLTISAFPGSTACLFQNKINRIYCCYWHVIFWMNEWLNERETVRLHLLLADSHLALAVKIILAVCHDDTTLVVILWLVREKRNQSTLGKICILLLMPDILWAIFINSTTSKRFFLLNFPLDLNLGFNYFYHRKRPQFKRTY